LTAPSATDIREVWAGELQPIKPELVDPRAPAEIRDFLTTVGLPRSDAPTTGFLRDRPLPVYTRLGRLHLQVAESLDRYPFGVDLEDGRLTLAWAGPAAPMFVNSGLAEFVYCTGSFERDVRAYVLAAAPSAKRRRRAVDRFRRMLADRDPAAVADATSYWPGMLTNVLEG